MSARSERVRAAFAEPDSYLKRDSHVRVRKLAVRELLGEVEGSRFLDLGCGDGRLSLQYLSATNRVTLVDLSSEMLALARRSTPRELAANVTFVQADLTDYTVEAGFDIVLCLGVLAHVDDAERLVARVGDLLAPEGRCIFQLTDSGRLTGGLLHACHALLGMLGRSGLHSTNRLSLRELDALAAGHGLKSIGCRRHFPLFPGMGLLPNRWLFAYQLGTMRRRRLARLGCEAITMYSKPASP